jgi:hypothetical protein
MRPMSRATSARGGTSQAKLGPHCDGKRDELSESIRLLDARGSKGVRSGSTVRTVRDP